MNKNIVIFIIGALLISAHGYSHKTCLLHKYIAQAIAPKLDQKNDEYTAEISKENYQQSKRNFLPALGCRLLME